MGNEGDTRAQALRGAHRDTHHQGRWCRQPSLDFQGTVALYLLFTTRGYMGQRTQKLWRQEPSIEGGETVLRRAWSPWWGGQARCVV